MKLKLFLALALALWPADCAQPALSPAQQSLASGDVLGAYLRKTLEEDLAQLNLLDRAFGNPKRQVRRSRRARKLRGSGTRGDSERKLGLEMDGMGGVGGLEEGGEFSDINAMLTSSGSTLTVESVSKKLDGISRAVGDVKDRITRDLSNLSTYVQMYRFQAAKKQALAEKAQQEKANKGGDNKNQNNKGSGGADRLLLDMHPNLLAFGRIEDHENNFAAMRAPSGLDIGIDSVAGQNLSAALADLPQPAA